MRVYAIALSTLGLVGGLTTLVGSPVFAQSGGQPALLKIPTLVAYDAATSASKLIDVKAVAAPKAFAIEGANNLFAKVDDLLLYEVDSQPASLTPSVLLVPKMKGRKKSFTVRLNVTNALPCSDKYSTDLTRPDHSRVSRTNTHLHGTMVAPRPPVTTKSGITYGDYVLAELPSGKGCANEMANGKPVGSVLPQGAIQAVNFPVNHASGLYWWHPHIHGFSGNQIMRGMAGLLSVGEMDYLETPPAVSKSAVHYIMLKDTQLTKSATGSGWSADVLHNATLCGKPATTPDGYCVDDPATPANAWVFTVNGSIFPNQSVDAATDKIVWRLGNLSANVTHRLQFKVEGAPPATGCLRPQVLSKDGVPVPNSPNKPLPAFACDSYVDGTSTYTGTNSLLTMPAARMDLLINKADACAAMGVLPANCAASKVRIVVQTAGIRTGVDNVVGDYWPAMNLASIEFAAKTTPAVLAGGTLGVGAAFAAAGSSQVAMPQFTTSSRMAARKPTPPKCSDNTSVALSAQLTPGAPGTDTVSGNYRWVGLQVVDATNDFLMSTAYRTAVNTPQDANFFAPQGTPNYQGFDHQRIDVCALAKFSKKANPVEGRRIYEEDWVIYNASKELHNFHIHQSKFSVQSIWMPNQVALGNTPINVDDSASYSKTGDTYRPKGDKAREYHDTFPVPIGGAIHIKIRFYPESAGRFVYHCHILEHEDGPLSALDPKKPNEFSRGHGMMSVIEMLDSAQLPSAAKTASTAGAAELTGSSHRH